MIALTRAIDEYTVLGFDTLPLIPGTKEPISPGWPNKPPNRMWPNAPDDANIGIRCGGTSQIAVIDCDEKNIPGTFDHAVNWLDSIGYKPGDYPVVKTVSGIGRHIYVIFSDGLSDSSRNLRKDIGAGEFRYGPGAFVGAPPSSVNGRFYTLLQGDFHNLPSVTIEDVGTIINTENAKVYTSNNVPRGALKLLNGKGIERYESRSEAEWAILVSLANAKHSFDSVESLFNRHPAAGKYKEEYRKNPGNACRWLEYSYRRAKQWAENHDSPARINAENAIAWAETHPWKGRGGSSNRVVYIAHCKIAHKAGRLTYAAGVRDLAELAGVSYKTASKATGRLRDKRLIQLVDDAKGDCANRYCLLHEKAKGNTTSHVLNRECYPLHNHDVFRWGEKGSLGKSAAEVWAVLQNGPASDKFIAEKTGRHLSTVRRALKRMGKIVDTVTGEILCMVEIDGDQWRALNNVDLVHIAKIMKTFGKGKRDAKKHREQRAKHRRQLAVAGRKKQ